MKKFKNNNWDKRIRREQAILKKKKYYHEMVRDYRPSFTGDSKTREIIHLYHIQVGDRDGGGEAIRLCLHFLLQHKVTAHSFECTYNAALEYVLNALVTGRVHYEGVKPQVARTKEDIEQMMRENLRGSGISLPVKEFMKINTLT